MPVRTLLPNVVTLTAVSVEGTVATVSLSSSAPGAVPGPAYELVWTPTVTGATQVLSSVGACVWRTAPSTCQFSFPYLYQKTSFRARVRSAESYVGELSNLITLSIGYTMLDAKVTASVVARSVTTSAVTLALSASRVSTASDGPAPQFVVSAPSAAPNTPFLTLSPSVCTWPSVEPATAVCQVVGLRPNVLYDLTVQVASDRAESGPAARSASAPALPGL